MDALGRYAFLAGLLLAVIAGLGVDQPWVGWVLALLGALVGLMNVAPGERNTFLIAGIALALSATVFTTTPIVGGVVTRVAESIMPFVGGAMFVVALMALFDTGGD